jgi:hypothetical protein
MNPRLLADLDRLSAMGRARGIGHGSGDFDEVPLVVRCEFPEQPGAKEVPLVPSGDDPTLPVDSFRDLKSSCR